MPHLNTSNFSASISSLSLSLSSKSQDLRTRRVVCQTPSPVRSLGELHCFVGRSWSPYHPCSSQFSISTNAHTTPLLWLMAELGRVPGQLLANSSEVRERTRERKARQGCRSCGFKACLSAPALPPLSISSLAPSGTHALARPQQPGSQDQGKGRGRGNKTLRETERDKGRASVQKMTGCLILLRNFERLRSRQLDVVRKGRLIRNNRRKQSVKVALLLFPLRFANRKLV